MSIIEDNRKYQAMTVEEVDDIFLRGGRVEAMIERETANHKKKLAELELAHKTKMDALLAEKRQLRAELDRAIMANQERFEEPKTHQVGNIGSYGIKQAPAKVEIKDPDAVVRFALENGYDDIIITTHAPDKRGLLKRFKAGEKIPGAILVPAGDVVVVNYKKGYAELLDKE